MSKRFSTLALALALRRSSPPVPAQSGKPMKLTLNFLAGGPQAGFMYAKKLGYYKDAGIDLTIEEGKGSATTAQLVATGQTDVAFADAPAAMQIRSKGAPVKIVTPILQTNGFAIISIEGTGINTPKDLLGKRLAVQPGTAQTTLLDAILLENKIDKTKLDIVNIDPAALVGALLEKKVDAILAGADFQSVQIRDRGFKVKDILYRDVGVPTVGLSIIARDERLKPIPISTRVRRGKPQGVGRGEEESRCGRRRGDRAVPRRDQGSDPEAAQGRSRPRLRARRDGARPRAGQELADHVRPPHHLSAAAEGQADHRLLHDRVPARRRAEVPMMVEAKRHALLAARRRAARPSSGAPSASSSRRRAGRSSRSTTSPSRSAAASS